MSSDSPSLLFVDDDPDIIKAARLLAQRHRMTLTGAADPAEAWALLAQQRFDVILLDLNFARGHTSGAEGFAMLDRLIAADRDAVVVVVTGHSGIAVAVQAMRGGASDFVIKPWSNERLIATIERALALSRAKRAVAPAPPGGDDRLILGESPAIARARTLAMQIAPSEAPVLLYGPAGSGKSLFARAIHAASAHADRALVVLPCASAVRWEAIASDLDASGDATLVLDEVGALPAEFQPRLASALPGRRVIATSRADRAALRAQLADDLLYAINTIEIALPPLAARADDALLLAQHFLAAAAGRYARPLRPFDEAAAQAIAAAQWEDDVRGLRQTIERAVLLAAGDAIGTADLALDPAPPVSAPPADDLNLERAERTLVELALKRHGFNVSRAAAELGLSRVALYRRMARYGL